MGNAFFSPKQVPLVPESSEPISVSNDSFALSMLPEEILQKIGNFADIKTVLNLIATCKYIRNQLNTWFLQLLASENNPDRATSGFIVDSIGNEGNTCFQRNANYFIEDHDTPKDLSIHQFANTTAKEIWSDEVRSMIVQFSGSPESYEKSREFIASLFLKTSFKNLKCLMVCGIELSNDFSQEIGKLNLDVFHMRNFRHHTSLAKHYFFDYWNSLKTLYVVHPDGDEDEDVNLPEKLKKLVIYCPKSSNDMINRRSVFDTGLCIIVKKCHALKEM